MISIASRRFMRFSFSIALFMGTLIAAHKALADVQYQWVFDRDTYLVDPGGTIDVSIYLQETVGTGDVSLLDPAGNVGMFSLGLGVYFGDDPQPADPAKVLDPANIMPNPAFDDRGSVQTRVFDTYATLVEPTTDIPVFGDLYGTNTYRLLAGTFTFTAGSIEGEITPLRASDNSEKLDDSYPFPLDLDAIDALIGEGFAKIQTTSVPEPSSIVLLGIAALCVGGWHWRRRRK